MKYWLVKTEPDTYSWERFVKEGYAVWEGVRNYQARNNLKSMKVGDRVLFYHSVQGKEIVGIATVDKESFPDPTSSDPRWCSVRLKPLRPFHRPRTLEEIKANKNLKNMVLVRNSRLSVQPVTSEEFDLISSRLFL